MSRMQGSFFADAAAVTASLYAACGNDCSSTLYLLWLALKSATTFLFTASSGALPPLCVHSFSVVTSPDVTAPLPDAPDEQATSPTAAPTASAATPRRRELFQGMVVPSSVPARTEPVGVIDRWCVSRRRCRGWFLLPPAAGSVLNGSAYRRASDERAGERHLCRTVALEPLYLPDECVDGSRTHLVVRQCHRREAGSKPV